MKSAPAAKETIDLCSSEEDVLVLDTQDSLNIQGSAETQGAHAFWQRVEHDIAHPPQQQEENHSGIPGREHCMMEVTPFCFVILLFVTVVSSFSMCIFIRCFVWCVFVRRSHR